jgi:hypothetical protein
MTLPHGYENGLKKDLVCKLNKYIYVPNNIHERGMTNSVTLFYYIWYLLIKVDGIYWNDTFILIWSR